MLMSLVKINQDLADKVNSIDMSAVVFKLVNQEETQSWGLEKVEEQVALYRKFLILNSLHTSGVVIPTKEIDKVWHTHILDTMKYTADCMYIFGCYLHHFPYFGLRGKQDEVELHNDFAKTCTLFETYFGISDYGNQKGNLADYGECADCGDGQISSRVKQLTNEEILAQSIPALGLYSDNKVRPRLQ